MSRRRRDRLSGEWARSRFGRHLRGMWLPDHLDATGNVRDLSVYGNDGVPDGLEFGRRPLSPQMGRAARVPLDSFGVEFGTDHGINPADGLALAVWLQPAGENLFEYLVDYEVGSGNTDRWTAEHITSGGNRLLRVRVFDAGGVSVLASVDIDTAHGRLPIIAYAWTEYDGSTWKATVGYRAPEIGGKWSHKGGDKSAAATSAQGRMHLCATTTGTPNSINGDWGSTLLFDRELTERELNELAHASGFDREIPAPYLRDYVSAYPAKTTRETKPEFYISSAGEPDPPEIDAGDESPTNLGKMFGATSIEVTADAASESPFWLGPWKGWEFGGDDLWSGDFPPGATAITAIFVLDHEAGLTNERHLMRLNGPAESQGVGIRFIAANNEIKFRAYDDSSGYAGPTMQVSDASQKGVVGMRFRYDPQTLEMEQNGRWLTESEEVDQTYTRTATDIYTLTKLELGSLIAGTFYGGLIKSEWMEDQVFDKLMSELAAKWGIS